MSWQIWDPPAIIIPAPPKAEIKAPAKKSISVDDHYKKVYDTPWNKLQPDGRINIDGSSSASISPYSKHFRSQIEDGIWPLVEILYLKGYLPVSSCAGHRNSLWKELETLFEYHSCPYVTIAVTREYEQEVAEHLQQFTTKYIEVSISHSQANMDASYASIGRIKKAKRKDVKNEYSSLNWMFKRNYIEWSYITIRINPWKRLSLSHVLRTQKEHAMIKELTEKYKNLPQYIF